MPLISTTDETLGLFFCGSNNCSPTRSKKGLWRTALVLSVLGVCWEIIWRYKLDAAKRWLAKGKEGREWWEWRRERRGGAAGEDDQSSGLFSIMSSPVSIDIRIKLLRDLPGLQCDQYGNVYPDVTNVFHRVTLNMTRPHEQPPPSVLLNRP